jgi:hypothetical protein
MPEARQALRTGKVPRKMGLIVEGSGLYTLTLSGESLAVSTLKLPDVEDAESPRVVFEERINALRDFTRTLDGLYGKFLSDRAGGSWTTTVREIRKWIGTGVGGQ